jgi:hypothetical protein
MGIREDSIREAIRNIDGSAFERFAYRILYEEFYKGLNPTSETYDFGEDARTEWTTLFQHQGKWVSVSASKTGTLAKLKEDCQTAKGKGRCIDVLVFATAGEPRRDKEEEWKEEIKNEFGWDLEVRSLEYFTRVASADRHASLVDDYLQIPPPGGDFIREIEDSFNRHTDRALRGARNQINGMTITRAELDSVEDQLGQGRQVLFTGDAGTGKSGVSKMLALAARRRGRCALLLDARQAGHVRSESELRAHLALKGPVESAVARVARARECRVIIDQFDNTVGSPSATVMSELAIACGRLDNTDVVVVSRKREAHEEKLLEQLSAAGFVELTSYPLSERKVSEALRRFGVEPYETLVDLSRNLLNLSLIATIKEQQPDFDFSTVTDEVDLWEQYLDVLNKEEGAGIDPGAGETLIAEAVKLAEDGLHSSDRTFALKYPHSPAHKRLVSWHIIIPEAGEDVHRFRHEKLHDFLVAWGAVRRGDLPPAIHARFNTHRTRNVFVWMDKLYVRRGAAWRKQFLKGLLVGGGVPFYTQAAVLDRYIKYDKPADDPEALEIIVGALTAEEGLREYFFRRAPHHAWAPVLWARGFFRNPPTPRNLNDNYLRQFWAEQDYLISVAAEVPEVIVGHLQAIPEDSGYIDQAIRGLCLIPGMTAETAVPWVLAWLEDDRTTPAVLGATPELIKHLVSEGRPLSALDLFRELTAPKPAPNPKEVVGHIIGGEAVSKFSLGAAMFEEVGELIKLLKAAGYGKVVAVLEEHLCSAVRMEASTKRLKDSQVWSFLEDPLDDASPYMDREYKNHLVRWLRDTLEAWVSADAPAVRPLIERYLSESQTILRRLGFHLLQKFPKPYRGLVARELRKVKNSDDWDIRDEFLKLLQNGYPVLGEKDREGLISRICRGLPRKEKRQWRRWVKENATAEDAAYVENLEKRWIRDRLAMIKENLQGEPALLLERLIGEVGEPDYPDPRRRYPIAYHVTEIGPLPAEELADMPPEELIRFLGEWQPGPEREVGPQRVTPRGLARTVADVMLGDLEKFGDYLFSVARMRYEFADALFDRLTNTDLYPLPWELKVSLCERLLGDDSVRTDVSQHSGRGWMGVRQTMLRVIETWFDESNRPVPAEYLPRVREVILLLTDDADPRPEDERPEEGVYGEKNPSVIAWSHVRPSALSTLIDYARYRAWLLEQAAGGGEPAGPGLSRLEPVVRETFTRKLDRHADPSPAVHSIYGRWLPQLLWLDKEWLESHIEQIFPEGDDEETEWLYAAAWDSYMRFSETVSIARVEMLRPKYERAIDNLSKGVVTRTSPEPGRELSNHLLIEYLNADYELRSPAGQDSMIVKFYARLSPPQHADAAWVLWKLCDVSRDRLDDYWPRARALWQWRVDAASADNHPADFDDEMNWFTLLLKIAHERETMTSLWPVLEGILPHVARSGTRHHGWDSVEEYLAKEVDRDPVNSIRYYRLMHTRRAESAWAFFGDKDADKIIETAADSEEARQEALDLIDLLGRNKNYRYMEIYNRRAN